MSIVQYYKSQVLVGGNKYPVPPGGGSLAWPRNIVAPAVAGNYFVLNSIEGLQSPILDMTVALLDASTTTNPLVSSNLNALFLTRSNDYQNDLSPISGGVTFFDGFSGWVFPNAKANSFSISGSKGSDISFSQNIWVFGSVPSAPINVAPDTYYAPFLGSPVRFQSIRLSRNGNCALMNGCYSFSVTASANLNSDAGMLGCGNASFPYQSVFPIDVNATMPSVSASFVFQADNNAYLADGDVINIRITQGLIDINFTLNNVVIETGLSRDIGSGRQLRTYACICKGTSNTVGPLTIS